MSSTSMECRLGHGNRHLDCQRGNHRHTWMIKRKRGFFGSYSLGLDPSKIPPWGVARLEDDAEAAAEVAATVWERREETDDIEVSMVVEDYICEERDVDVGEFICLPIYVPAGEARLTPLCSPGLFVGLIPLRHRCRPRARGPPPCSQLVLTCYYISNEGSI